MTGCPSRKQLAELVAEQAVESDGLEFDSHVRNCPTCRAVIQSIAQEGTTDSGRGSPKTGPEKWSLPQSNDGGGNTLAASDQTLETFGVGRKPPLLGRPEAPSPSIDSSFDTIDTAFRSSDSVAADATIDSAFRHEPSSSQTIDSAFRALTDSASMDTIDTPKSVSAPWALKTLGAGPQSSGAPAAFDATLPATFSGATSASEVTLDVSSESAPAQRKTVHGVSPPPNFGGKRGPADYEILGELGRGGMGVVYKARDRRLNRLVALKMIRGAAHADDIQVTRFRIEAEAVAALKHPNILQIYDIGESEGMPFVALELLEGGSLAEKLHGTPLPPRKAAEWMVPMALAMDTAHAAGIVHRDLKSVNILFTADGVPKVTDFGLAKRLEVDEGHTHTGQVMGTPSYMAPEQARGDTKMVGPAADIYALGAILYEMLTGRPPFKGVSAMDTVKQVIEVEPVAPSRVQYKVPRDLETICLKCLQKEARKRYPTAKEMADDLNRYLRGEPIRARRTPPVERAAKWVRRHPTQSTLMAFATLGILAAATTALWYWNQQRNLERLAVAHEAEVREATGDDLFRAQGLIAKSALDQARDLLVSRKTSLDGENGASLASLRDRTRNMLAEVEASLEAGRAREAAQRAKEVVLGRYRNFLDHRKEALFRDTQFTGLMQPTNVEQTAQATETALGDFGKFAADGGWTLSDLPQALTAEQQADVKEGSYELLLVLAGTKAGQGPEKVDGALKLLASADQLRPEHSQAYHQRMAACLTIKGDRAGAAREQAEAERVRPVTAFDFFLTGQHAYKQKQYSEAIRDFEKALRQKPDHFWSKCLQAICYIQTSEYKGAKASLNDCIETDPNFAWLYLLRGFASGQLAARYQKIVATTPARAAEIKKSTDDEFEAADADFQQALTRLASAPDKDLQYILLVNRGLIRFQRDQLKEATADFQEAIQLQNDRFEAHAELAHVYEKEDKTDLAVEQFTRAIALKPEWAPLYRGRAKVLAAASLKDPKRRGPALADLEKSIFYQKKAPDRVLALDHLSRAELLYADEQYESALAECRLALEVDPRFPNAHVLHVRTLLKLGRIDEVIRSCDAAIQLGEKSAVLYEIRGLANSDRRDYRAAIRDFGQALEIDPNHAQYLTERGWSYLLLDSPRLAFADFAAAIKIKSDSADAYNGRGAALALRGDHAAAAADAREATKYSAGNARDLYNAARVYALAATAANKETGEKGRQARIVAGKYEDAALQLIRQAFEHQPPDKRAAFWRNTVQPDPAWNAIRRRIKFEDLIVTKE
jgi:tetratricopeptide (TPR) repeat protein/tRNA A-37 threonylcarbamoyl transferase component Bud32